MTARGRRPRPSKFDD